MIGCGGHGRVVADVAEQLGYHRIAFLDDAFQTFSAEDPWEVIGPPDRMYSLLEQWPEAIATSGSNEKRLSVHLTLQRLGFHIPNIIHHSAVISRRTQLGTGIFVGPSAVVNAGALIADAAIVNTGAIVEHDCFIDSGAHVAPGAVLAGHVHVGLHSLLGAGSAVRQGIKIGANVTVGVGAAVVSDLNDSGTYAGVPARKIVPTE